MKDEESSRLEGSEEIEEKVLLHDGGEQQQQQKPYYPKANKPIVLLLPSHDVAPRINQSSLRFYTGVLFLVGLANIALFGWHQWQGKPSYFHNTIQEKPLVVVVVSDGRGPPPQTTNPLASIIETLRNDIAALSIELMQNDTVAEAAKSPYVDIGPLYDLVDIALDTIGVRGVHGELLDARPFLVSLMAAAKAKDLHQDFHVYYYENKEDGEHHQPMVQYTGIPNDRHGVGSKYTMGSIWWLYHWVGAISADKLLRDGSLRVDAASSSKNDRLYSAASFMKELQDLQQLDEYYANLMPFFHSQHGFVWHYLTVTMPDLDAYPLQIAEEFCGNQLLWEDEYDVLEDVPNDIGPRDECRHGIGHAVFYILLMRQLGKKNVTETSSFSARSQLRAASGLVLNEESMCEAYTKICSGAPNDKTREECHGGLRHSYQIFDNSTTNNSSSNQDLEAFLLEQTTRCKLHANGAVGAFLVNSMILLPGQISTSDHHSGVLPVFLVQQPDGNLVLHAGTPEKGSLAILWSSGFVGAPGKEYFTVLQGDGRLITKEGTPDKKPNLAVWKTGAHGNYGDYFLYYDADVMKLSIRTGLPSHPGDILWSAAAASVVGH
jgi:hypothetical protein